jgi:hypothetical protein
MKGIKKLITALLFALPFTGQSQIQSIEFAYGITNSLSIPLGKIIRIHSLIGSNSGGMYDNSAINLVSQSANLAKEGLTIVLPSGREISLSPFRFFMGGSGSSIGGVTTLSAIDSVSPNSPLLIPGPITILKKGDSNFLLVYEIQDNLGSTSLAQVPSQGSSVVIPTSVAGDVDVKMEQSADNITWTECLPGTYNSSTVKRFFRLRAVEK